MSVTTLVETATASCPASTLTMSGVEDNDALEALAATVQTWSDGYKFSLAVTLATINADTGNASKLVYSFGQGFRLPLPSPLVLTLPPGQRMPLMLRMLMLSLFTLPPSPPPRTYRISLSLV